MADVPQTIILSFILLALALVGYYAHMGRLPFVDKWQRRRYRQPQQRPIAPQKRPSKPEGRPHLPVTAAPPPSRPAQPVLPLSPIQEWWPQANRGDRRHWIVLGESQSGKTTLVLAHLNDCIVQGDEIAVIDTHGNRNPWPQGVTIWGNGRDYEAVDRVLNELLTELDRRSKLPADRELPWVSIFVDEWPSLASKISGKPRVAVAERFMTEFAQEALKFHMRLVLMAQSPTVKSLGIEGSGAVRNNFIPFLLGSFALEFPKTRPTFYGVKYPAVIDWRGTAIPVSTRFIPDLASRPAPAPVNWQPPEPERLPDLAIYGEALEADSAPDSKRSGEWTEDHVKVAAWLVAEPGITDREISRRLFDGKSGGNYNKKVERIREAVTAVTGVTPVTDAPPRLKIVANDL